MRCAKPNIKGSRRFYSFGTKTVTVKDTASQTLSISFYGVTSGILIAQETYSNFDGWNRPGRVTHLDGTFEDTVYGCCGPDSVTDRDGVSTAYAYDNLKRRTVESRNNISLLSTYDASSRLTRTQRQGTNGNTITLNQTAYDFAGRVQYQTNGLGGVTSYTYGTNASGQLTTTVTNADGGTRIELCYADGRLAKVTGTAVSPVRYDYGVESEGGVYRVYIKEIKLDASFADTTEWTKTCTDLSRAATTWRKTGGVKIPNYDFMWISVMVIGASCPWIQSPFHRRPGALLAKFWNPCDWLLHRRPQSPADRWSRRARTRVR